MDFAGAKGYLLRRSLINSEANKILNLKSPILSSNKKRSSVLSLPQTNSEMIKINKEYSDLQLLSKNNKKIENDKELENITKKLERKYLRNLKRSSGNITTYNSTFMKNNFSNNDLLNNNVVHKSNSKKFNFDKFKDKKGKIKLKDVLNELNEYTDKLGITKESERQNYINDKEKRKFFLKEIQKQFKNKVDKKLQLFSPTSKLNKYLINDYFMSEYNQNSDFAKKKLKITQNTIEQINKERMKNLYQQSQNYFIPDKDRDTFYYNLTHNNKDEIKKRSYSERDMKKIKENYYSTLSQEKMKKNLKLFNKIRNLNNEGYIDINPSNQIEFNNLERVIRIKKYKKKCINEDLTRKKEKLKDEEANVLLCLSKFKPSVLYERPFRASTINQYKSVCGIYFGLPV